LLWLLCRWGSHELFSLSHTLTLPISSS
jgi:hypothetical protein